MPPDRIHEPSHRYRFVTKRRYFFLSDFSDTGACPDAASDA